MRILVIGAGFAGATAANLLANAGHLVSVIDRRSHVAGNAYDYINEHGIRVHAYGPHLFHTSNAAVFEYLSKFTTWVEYKHRVKALLSDGTYVTLPVNRTTADIVGKDNIIDVFYRPYTQKMWGMSLEEVDPSITARVQIRDDDNEYYFPDDIYQYMPEHGYTQLITNMLAHENIDIRLSTEYMHSMRDDYDHIFNSMPIDEYHGFCHGELPYRSIRFHTSHVPSPRLLPVATVNFTHDGKYTRMTEWKNMPCHGVNPYMTTITFEEPCDYRDNDLERYYPVKDMAGHNRDKYKKYAAIEDSKVTFIGRCGLYAYLDMHAAISSTMSIVKTFIGENTL